MLRSQAEPAHQATENQLPRLENSSAIHINNTLPDCPGWPSGAQKIKQNKALSEITQYQMDDDLYHHLWVIDRLTAMGHRAEATALITVCAPHVPG